MYNLRFLSAAVFVFVFTNSSVLDCLADVAKPGKQLIETIDQLKNTVIKEKNTLSAEQLEQKLADQILPRFDFQEMSQRSLGPSWRIATAEEKKEFVDLFSDLLVRTYITKIRKNLETSTVKLAEEKVEGEKAVIRTKVDDGKDTVQIDYRLLLRNGEWQVYDVIVENVGLVSNYRSEFAAIVQKDKMQGLLVKLRDKKAKRVEDSGKAA